MTPIALTIAGSDSSGGAGIQADLKTFSALGVYGASAITAVTAQNTLGVQGVCPVPVDVISAQINSVLSDLNVAAIKIGMLANAEIIAAVFAALKHASCPVVVDPVMVAQSGDSLFDKSALHALQKIALPRASLITPNLPEAAALLQCAEAVTIEHMEAQAKALLQSGAQAVLLKGGHAAMSESTDIFVYEDKIEHLSSPRTATRNTHGTGCSLSSAIAGYLARGLSLNKAVHAAKNWISAAIAAADELEIGKGAGPVHHFHALWDKLD